MVETNQNGNEASSWGYLIRPDKSATTRLEQLCLGLAQIIGNLESGQQPNDRLTPRRLAAFYRSIGGNLDTLFLRTSESGLSFLYRTIGCFHSLESTGNPFKTPSMPCLTPNGFVKWQTVQLLLCPDEHVRYLQAAVKAYDVPRPDGGVFPKTIPRSSFPAKPDPEMEDWHKKVTSQLNQESYMQRLRNSPYVSPYPSDRVDGYFSQSIPQVQNPNRPSRSESRDGHSSHHNPRRSSEPDFGSPIDPDQTRKPQTHTRDPRVRSASAHRPGVGPRQRSATTGSNGRPVTSHSSRTGNDRPPPSFVRGQHPDRPGRTPVRRSPSISSFGESSADDASSEDSRGQRRSKRSRVTSTILSVLPFTSPREKRSQSHDTSTYRHKERPSPRRESRDGRRTPPPARVNPDPVHHRSPSVRFKQDMFDNYAAASAPESAPYDRRPQSTHRPDPRLARNPGLTDPVSSVNYNLTREVSNGSGSENRSGHEMPGRPLRKNGVLPRHSTQVGVSGRKYASLENSSGQSHPTQSQQEARARYSLAV